MPALLVALICGCGEARNGPAGVELDLESRRPRQMAAFYLGAFGTPEQVSASLTRGGSPRILLDSVAVYAPGLADALRPLAEDGTLTLDEFTETATAHYAGGAALPQDVGALRTLSPELLTHEVSGSMTRYRRRLQIERAAVQGMLANVLRGERALYATGTVIVGEHLDGEGVVETTAMIKRADGFWNFAAYGADGRLVGAIEGDPDPLQVPRDCFGCHYGTRAFEPEASFPGFARPGPFGQRGVYVDSTLRRPDVTSVLDEHRRRADGVLGLYGTLYLADLAGRAERGEPLDSLDTELLGLLQ